MKVLFSLNTFIFTLTSFATSSDFREVSPEEAKLINRAVSHGLQRAYFHCERREEDEVQESYQALAETKVFVREDAQPALKIIFKSTMTVQESLMTTNKDFTTIEHLLLKSTTFEKKTMNVGTIIKPVYVLREVPVPEYEIECGY